jgi:hypothetical protein
LVFGDSILEGPPLHLERPRLRTLRAEGSDLTQRRQEARGEEVQLAVCRGADTKHDPTRVARGRAIHAASNSEVRRVSQLGCEGSHACTRPVFFGSHALRRCRSAACFALPLLITQILLAKSGLAHTFPALYAKGDCETQNKESGGETL